ncbi:hypothetical protein [Nocardia wallacei]|uniref:hypothetical protein n=1 Tax=Nocardia wallacei TaxID=480035 RepID=UPI002453C323|nr:hypothetical protein [Nocardia wallacei]
MNTPAAHSNTARTIAFAIGLLAAATLLVTGVCWLLARGGEQAVLFVSALTLLGSVACLIGTRYYHLQAQQSVEDADAAATAAEAARDAIAPRYREDARPAAERPSLVAVSDETLAAIRSAEWCRNARSGR